MERQFRATARTRVTKIAQSVDQLLSNGQKTVMDCKIVLAKLEYAEARLLEADEAFNKTLTEDTVGSEFETIDEYNDLIIDRKVRLNECINELTLEISRNETNTSERRIETPGLKIPKIEMIKFGGNINEWISFWDQFVTIIHNNSGFSDIARFNYLRSLLYGKALDLVKGLLPSADSYEQAIRILTSEYGSKERIVESLVNELAGISQVRNSNDTDRLRALLNKFNSIMRSLESLKIDPHRYQLTARTNLLRCMPLDLRIEFFKNHSQEHRNELQTDSTNSGLRPDPDKRQIEELVGFFEAHVRAFERNIEASNVVAASGRFYPKVGHAGQSSASALMTVKSGCVFCRSVMHEPAECDKVMSVSDRKAILLSNRRCYRCAKPNHTSKYCRDRFLRCDHCGLRHLTILCDPDYKKESIAPSQSDINTTNLNVFDNTNKKQVFLQTAQVIVKAKDNKKKQIRIVLDGGSQLTFVKQSLIESIKCRIIGEQKLSISTFGNSGSAPRFYKRVSIDLNSRYGGEGVSIVAVVVPEICLNVLNSPKLIKFESRYQDFLWADCGSSSASDEDISILVGADSYWKIVTGEVERLSDTFTAINTSFGWTLHGESNLNMSNNECNLITALSVVNSIEIEDDTLTKFWDLETLGISGEPTELKRSEKFIETFISDNIKLLNGRYCVSLPWKSTEINLNSNYFGAKLHLNYLTKNLSKDPVRLSQYHEAVMEYIRNDIAELVNYSANTHTKQIYYMPHRPVYKNDSETTKIRVVFNASAHRKDEQSLNDLLDSGVPLNLEAIRLLLCFRFGVTALTADIEKAFLQISLAEEDRDSHRFLWYDRSPCANNDAKIVAYRMKRVTFGVTCSPFLLAVVIRKLFEDFGSTDKETCSLISRHFYVDDYIISTNSLEKANSFVNVAKSIFSKASMNLRKWQTNDTYLREQFNLFDTCKTKKLLGLLWDTSADTVSVDLSSPAEYLELIGEKTMSKRKALQFVARIYDPLGFLGPVTVNFKIFLQNLWKAKLDWDENLPQEFYTQWKKCVYEFKRLTSWSLERCVDQKNVKSHEIHIFADSSIKAYGTVAYVRAENDKDVMTRMLYARNRLAPLKIGNDSSELTIPKLELTACLMAVRLYKFLKTNLEISGNYRLWTDSQIALAWIKNDSFKLKPYVANRVKEIRAEADISLWNYCSGESNPADLLTRGLSVKEFLESRLWKVGPDWLRSNSQHQIAQNKLVTTILETDFNCPNDSRQGEAIFPSNLFSKWRKILNVTAYIYRFIANCQTKIRPLSLFLGVGELSKAERYWIQNEQSMYYGDEKNNLIKGVPIKPSSSILRLSPFLQDGFIRARSRLDNYCSDYEFKYPIILPKKSIIVRKMIEHLHVDHNHASVGVLVVKMRERFWIPSLRTLSKSVVSRCVTCRKLFSKHLTETDGQLPIERLSANRAFENVGLDFAGPLITKNGDKVYILLFTCAMIRAVHLELCGSMTVEDFFKAFRKFISRRGVPDVIFSDNFRTFKRAKEELKLLNNIMEDEKIRSYFYNKKIEWKFIVERAPWWGGFWERMVRTVKNSLKLSIGKASLNTVDLEVVLCEVEALINSRPLYCPREGLDELSPLTPNDILIGRRGTPGLCTLTYKNSISTHNNLVKFWSERQYATKLFFKRWKTEYLGQLRSTMVRGSTKTREVKMDEVYLVGDNCAPRVNWKLAKVTKLIPAKDGRVRAVQLRTATGQTINRAIQLLYPLEVGREC